MDAAPRPPPRRLRGLPEFDALAVDRAGRVSLACSATGRGLCFPAREIVRAEDGGDFVRIHRLSNASGTAKATVGLPMARVRAAFLEGYGRLPWKD